MKGGKEIGYWTHSEAFDKIFTRFWERTGRPFVLISGIIWRSVHLHGLWGRSHRMSMEKSQAMMEAK